MWVVWAKRVENPGPMVIIGQLDDDLTVDEAWATLCDNLRIDKRFNSIDLVLKIEKGERK